MQILIIAILLGVSFAQNIVLNTKSGLIKGRAGLVPDVHAFLGIPFAEPPVGNLRFKKPVPKAPWNKTYDAINIAPPCAQFSIEPYYFMPDVTNMSEDCLYLNIWVPKTFNHSRRPILIFIHGGGFTTGATNLKFYDGSKLAKRGKMIVATIGYRLGAFGFFFGDHEEAPGNMGMHDQIMAMRWIKDNAEVFGGDPENVVLMGESAGSFCVSIHLVSPLSQPLFKRAIMESGAAVHPFFFDDNSRNRKNSKTVASILKCTNGTVTLKNNPHSVIECLRRKPVEDFIEAEKRMQAGNVLSFLPAMNDELLPKSAVDLFREGKFKKDMDVLIGINRDEGTMMLVSALPDYFGYYGVDSVPMTKSRARLIATGESMLINHKNASKVINRYFGQLKNKSSTGFMQMLADIVGDFIVACGTVFLADFLSLKGNSVHFYKFDFRASSTPMAEWIGVSHMDELQYVFGNPFHENFTSEEKELSNRLMDRWSAFSRTGNPNIPGHLPWLRYNYHNRWYLNFGQDEESIRMDPLHRCEIWREDFRAGIDPPLIRFLRNSRYESFIEKIRVL